MPNLSYNEKRVVERGFLAIVEKRKSER